MTITKTYCDRCGEEVTYPTERKLHLSGVGREGGYDLCDSCYDKLYNWFCNTDMVNPFSKNFSINEIVYILVKHGQRNPQFHLGDTIKYSPSEIRNILEMEVNADE